MPKPLAFFLYSCYTVSISIDMDTIHFPAFCHRFPDCINSYAYIFCALFYSYSLWGNRLSAQHFNYGSTYTAPRPNQIGYRKISISPPV